MKRLFLSLLFSSIFLGLHAETPHTIAYQAVVRDAKGEVLKEKNVSVKIFILHNSESGEIVYEEERTVSTNKNGLVAFSIGDDFAEPINRLILLIGPMESIS